MFTASQCVAGSSRINGSTGVPSKFISIDLMFIYFYLQGHFPPLNPTLCLVVEPESVVEFCLACLYLPTLFGTSPVTKDNIGNLDKNCK